MGDVTLREVWFYARWLLFFAFIVWLAALYSGATTPALPLRLLGYHCVASRHVMMCAH